MVIWKFLSLENLADETCVKKKESYLTLGRKKWSLSNGLYLIVQKENYRSFEYFVSLRYQFMKLSQFDLLSINAILQKRGHLAIKQF